MIELFSFGTVLASHIMASVYMAKPRFNKWITTLVWIIYAFVYTCCIFTGIDKRFVFFISLIVQAVFFLLTAKGKACEKVFLLLSYAAIFCTGLGINMVIESHYIYIFRISRIIIPIIMLVLMHAVLFGVLIPIYRKAIVFIETGWTKLHVVILLFLLLFILQCIYPYTMSSSEPGRVVIFLVSVTAFYSSFFVVFSSIEAMAENNRQLLVNQELKHLAYIDALTGLKNRAAYIKSIKAVSRQYRISAVSYAAIIILDIDGFKKINDELGHHEGDNVLINVAERLNEIFFEINYGVFRIGGDEFAVVAEDKNEEEILLKIEALNKILAEKSKVTVSVGYAFVNFSEEDAINRAFKEADRKMYENKRNKIAL